MATGGMVNILIEQLASHLKFESIFWQFVLDLVDLLEKTDEVIDPLVHIS